MIGRAATMLVTAALISLVAAPATWSAEHHWKTYRNIRFGFQMVYPRDLFKPGKQPTDGAGLDFTAKDGAEILAQASFNVDTGVTPESYRKELKEGETVISEEGEGNWFVVVRKEKEDVLYDRVVFTCDNQLLNQASISYPAAKSELYAPIAKRVALSFKPGKGEDNPADCKDPTR
jgi:hypothetical protein